MLTPEQQRTATLHALARQENRAAVQHVAETILTAVCPEGQIHSTPRFLYSTVTSKRGRLVATVSHTEKGIEVHAWEDAFGVKRLRKLNVVTHWKKS